MYGLHCRGLRPAKGSVDADLRRGGDRRGTGRRGGGGTTRRRGAQRGDRRGPPGRRGMLVLGVHAVEGAAAALRGAGRGPADTRRGRGGDRHARRAGGARPARRDHPRPRRRVAAAVARGARHRAVPRAGPTGRRAACRGRRRGARGHARGHPLDRVAAVDAADRGARRDRRRVDQPRCHHHEDDPRAARDHGRRRGRRRDVAGVPDARLAGDADRGRAPAAAARGGVRLRAADRRADRVRRRHPHGPEGDGGGRAATGPSW